MHISARGIELIIRWEGFEPEYYTCIGGERTIGFGHVGPLPPGFEAPLSQDAALRLLQIDLVPRMHAVSDYVTVALSQPQFDALCSFVYNVGIAAFRGSTLLRRLNAGCYDEAASELLRWIYVDGEVAEGLVLRRQAERELFLSESTTWLEKARQIPLRRMVPMDPELL